MHSLFQHFSDRSRHQRPWWDWVLLLELVTHLLHGHKLNAFVFLKMLNKPVRLIIRLIISD